MEIQKLKGLQQIKEDLYDLYPNAIKIALTVEGDKIVITPTEKYEIKPEALVEE